MNKLYALFFILITCAPAFAGTGGPDTYGYTWKDSNEPDGPVYKWIDITTYPNATSVKLLGDDNSRGPFVMNFNFHYYWYDVNQFWVGSNGYLLFQDGQIASPFPTCPTSSLPNDVLGVLMNDFSFLNVDNPGQCWYYLNPALDTLIVSWIDVPFFDIVPAGFSGSNTFQVILSAVDSSITYQYKAVDPNDPVLLTQSSVGMENYSGSIGLQYPSAFTKQTPSDSFAIKFYYPNPPLVSSITDATVTQVDNPSTGAVFVSNSGNPYTLNSDVRNYSLDTVAPFGVYGKLKNPDGTSVSETVNTDTMLPAQTSTVTYNIQVPTDSVGIYKFTSTTQLAGDQVNSNNSKQFGIIVLDTTQTEIWMGYHGMTNNANASLNWIGGSGGAGNYYIPPFYPCTITKLHYFITSFTSTDAFVAKAYDDDGANGLPYTLLDSIYVPSANIVLNGWTDVTLNAPIVINSGGFYLSWDEVGETIILGCSTADPISNRSYEEFQGIWGIFRYRETEDPLIACTITTGSYPTAVQPADLAITSLSVYPNPAVDQVTLAYNASIANVNNFLTITDVQGKTVNEIDLGKGAGQHELTLDVSHLTAGIYFATLINGKAKAVQKMVITE